MYEAFDQLNGWNGTRDGTPVEPGTYVYYLKAICVNNNSEIKLKGTISIVK